ncbi:ATP-dependent DNA helicase RecG [Candidatus Vallotiella sp. (ex Adelges kitamiensis)]|uniref:ATP-dependent DNA helicase RecG n=1 Tax=Candidatus Vallotiella sp. (ex Adelges kitamiensis) TaxID=2864217 RepID=UPI001CE25DA3|nr:ATP-dependent DNA helicase RecG [Candidatus Vallotia sp. (ex Adelges kitamiensis)]
MKLSTAALAQPTNNKLNSRLGDKLVRLGLIRDIDLVLHFPIRYEDETRLIPIRKLLPGMTAQVEGEIVRSEIICQPCRQMLVRLRDKNGDVLMLRFLKFWGSQMRQFAPGVRLRARSNLRVGFFGIEMVHPAYYILKKDMPLPIVLTPVYPSIAGVSQAYLRHAINSALQRTLLPEILPPRIIEDFLAPFPLPRLSHAVRILHNPRSDIDKTVFINRTHPAWLRIKFEELIAQQLSLKLSYKERRFRVAPALASRSGAREALVTQFRAALLFQLTNAQQRAIKQISADLAATHPMYRLLQGDVGSGKTVVAALAAAQAIDAGYQVALMTPTKLLAEQHFHKLRSWLEPLGVYTTWLAGSMRACDKHAALEAVARGDTQLIVGTQAMIQGTVKFARLGFVIIDEQHRFGVKQRLALCAKAQIEDIASGFQPHQLMMSATPIPRTLAMTYYADLDVSTIDELPPGRTPVLTKLVSDVRRDEVISRVRTSALNGNQVYWVCPLIEESEALQLQTVVDTYKVLVDALPQLRVGLVHGRLKATNKAKVMANFIHKKIHLLVTTTVIEVGVDVPNASLMVIEHAERFGLAQLHQLRGRVGRGGQSSVCLLMYTNPLSLAARERLRIIRETTDGFEIARRDLEIRGPGEFFGARQSGTMLLRFVDIKEDAWMIKPAQLAADRLLSEYPKAAAEHLTRWLGARELYLKA